MSLEPIPLTSADAASSGPSQAEIDACDIAMLRELAEITMGVARAIGQLALDRAAEGDAEAAARLGAVITRVGRAVRQSVAYRRKIESKVREQDGKRAAAQATAKAAAGERVQQAKRDASAARRAMIENAVTRLLDDEDEDLYGELAERLDEYETFTDFTDRPVSTFVSDICKALKLKFRWDRFEYDPWAAEEAKADPPASPFAEWWHSVHGVHGGADAGARGGILVAPPNIRASGHGPPAAAG
jgi:hypothetical protein